MTRKLLAALLAVIGLMSSVLALHADAGPTCPYRAAPPVIDVPVVNDTFSASAVSNGAAQPACATALPYPGPFTNMPRVPPGPYGFGTAPV